MTYAPDQAMADRIGQLCALAHDRLPSADVEDAIGFIQHFYRLVPPGDVLKLEAEDLYGAAVGFWRFGSQRSPGRAKLRVFNPTYDEHGWHTSHTVVEIVNDDMPFLVDSVTSALLQAGLNVHLVIHPVMSVVRDAAGLCTALAASGSGNGGGQAESFMHVEVDELTAAADLVNLETLLARVLDDTRAAVEDWQAMLARLAALEERFRTRPPVGIPPAEVEEVLAFFDWLGANNYTFLGYREYSFIESDQRTELVILPDAGLGVLRRTEVSVFEGMRQYSALPPEIQQFIRQPRLLMVTKGNMRSTVHRPVHVDTLVIKSFDDQGEVDGEYLFVGLFTSQAYTTNARDIPLLRRKVARAFADSGLDGGGHDGKTLTHILNTYPRDELFQLGDGELLANAIGILHLQERPRTALFVRRDAYERFVSCIVFVPRDRFSTELRTRFQAILEHAFNGRLSAFSTQLSDGIHGRIHYIIETVPGSIPDIRPEEVETRLVEAGRSWSDRLADALVEAKGEEPGLTLLRRYGEAFPTAYRETTVPAAAIGDIDRAEAVAASGWIALNLYRPVGAPETQVRFKLYHPDNPVPLSDVLPMLEDMGFRVESEVPIEVRPAGGRAGAIWIHDFAMSERDGRPIDLGAIKDLFQEALERVWTGDMEADGFNALVQGARLSWREVVVLRAYAKFLRQAGFALSQDLVERTLTAHPTIARLLVELFQVRFDPALETDRLSRAGGVVSALEHALDDVENLDEDRTLRRFINLIRATLRTNFYQRDAEGRVKPHLALKLDSQAIDGLPPPRPMVEVFVYSPRVEAVHLRGGKVARGGIRWSDRREDFRTEVLGLMKAQMVKNAVIVPVGSKGGFVLKRPPRERDALQAEGIAGYRTMMQGLLDVTDDLDGSDVVPPPDTVRADTDDPYLVVAADKGTATFSDIANAIARERGFWLDDAFASGGSAGYDHKKMGITARGAWESVKRNFRELGTDIQNQPFTVIGIGDMSGDVFGNGMLLSRQIRLVAAFNHLHIFLDPDPHAETGFAERERLFREVRGWDHYDRALISPGGGVFERRAKSIRLDPAVRERFALPRETVTPNELIAALLRSPCDLMWFGGIGTYVKAAEESHADVGDKTNDPVRVDARALNARVIGEGANLALTQRGRIEYARLGAGGRGGIVNTDFIDNSAGVDCSDHEVNIKILLGKVMAAGDMTEKQRNQLLESMTDEVAALVLRDNYLQTQAVSMTLADGFELLEEQTRLMKALEKAGKLDRAIETLPNDEELMERLGRREGLNRPELCVLLCYAKITLYDQLLASDLPEDAALVDDLHRYFPKPLRKRFVREIERHPLRREIIATWVTNAVVNRTGPTFVAEMTDKTGLGPSDVARAFLVVRDVFALRDLWLAIEALDNRVPATVQTQMLLITRRLVERETAWMLRWHGQELDIGRLIARFRPGVEAVVATLDDILYPEARSVLGERVEAMMADGVPEDLAARVASLNVVAASLDLVRVSEATGQGITDVAPVYFALGHRLGIAWLRDQAIRMPAGNHWQKQAVTATIDDLNGLQAELASRLLDGARAGTPGEDAPAIDGAALLEAWIARRRAPVERIDQLIAELRALTAVDIAMLTVASRRLRSLVSG